MGRIHRYDKRKDCLIFNFVAANTIEGRVLEKLQKIRDALDDDNVAGEALTPAHIERMLHDDYAGGWATSTWKSGCCATWTRKASAR